MASIPQEKQSSAAVREEMNRPGQAEPAEAQAEAPPREAGGEGGSPADDEQYSQLMDNISIMIDGEKGAMEAHESIMSMLDQGRDMPGDALGNALFSVSETIVKQAEQNGIQITDDMLVAAAMDTLMMLVELASEANFFEATDEDIANGYASALMKFMQTHPDLVDWKGLQAEMENLDPQAVESAKTMFNAQPAQGGGAPMGSGQPPQAQPGGAPQSPGGMMGAQ